MGADESKTRLPADSIKDGVIQTSLSVKQVIKKYNFPTRWNNSIKQISYKKIIQNGEFNKFRNMYEKGDLILMKIFNCSNILDGDIGKIYHIYKYDLCKLDFDNLKFTNCLAFYLE